MVKKFFYSPADSQASYKNLLQNQSKQEGKKEYIYRSEIFLFKFQNLNIWA
jgi:hypothetical protein